MTVKERNRDLQMVAELVREHLFEHVNDSDLCKDICAVLAITLRRVHEDTEKSANAWDKRAYHSKADALRRQMSWVLPMAQLAESLAYSSAPFMLDDAMRLRAMLPASIEASKRVHFKDIERLRGAAAAARQTLLKRR